MRRCIVCGNTDNNNHTVCNICGGSFVDIPGSESSEEAIAETTVAEEETVEVMAEETEELPEEAEEMPEMEQEEETEEEPETEKETEKKPEIQAAEPPMKETPTVEVKEPVQQRRMKSGPQVYGQAGMTQKNGNPYSGQQGMVRRNIQGGAPQGRPMNGPQGQPMNRPQGRPVNGPQGRPMNGPQGQPMNGPQGRPMNGPQGRPMNGPQGQPMNRPQGRPMNGPQGRPGQGASYGRYRMQIMETARGMLKSPLFFLIVFLNTVYLAGSIAAIFMKELNFSLYAGLLADISFPAQIAGYMTDLLAIFTKLDTGAVIVNLVIHIPDMLFCLGVWVIFISALSAKENMSGAGFSMVKIVMILRMVVYCILMLAGLLISVTLVVAAWISGVQSMLIASVVTLVLMIVITMMLIMYYFSYFATMKTCRVNADNGDVYGSVSSYVAGLQIIMALFSVINLLSGIVNAEISNIAGSAGKMGWMILLGIWMFRYKSKLSEFDEQ